MFLQHHGVLQQISGGTSPFSPSGITNLVGWWGDNVNGVDRNTLANGTEVSTWDDLSGNNNDWYKDGTTPAPSYNATDDQIEFNGTNDLLRNDFRVGYSANTIFYVATPNNNSTAAYQISNQWVDGESGSTKNSFAFISKYNNGGIQALEFFGSNTSLPRLSWGDAASVTGFNIFRYQQDKNTINELFLNDVFVTSGSSSTSIDDSEVRWRIMGSARFSPSVTKANFNIKEIIVYNRLLTNSEIADVEQYLNDKYNIY